MAKVLAAMLMLVLLGGSLALAADGPGGEPGGSSQAEGLTASPLPEGAEELPAKRTATSRTYELPNGSRETRIYQAPVNYRDGDGKWQPIEEGLKGGDGSALSNGDNSFDLALPARLGDGPVRFSKDGAWVASRFLGEPSEPVDLKAGAATYQLNPQTSVELSTLPDGIKENIEIASPSAPSTFRFELSASAGVKPATAKDGAIEFRDPDDHLVARLPAPFMFDSSGTPDGFSTAVDYKLEPKDSGGWLLTVEASKEWLNDPSRKWPVTIDPSILFGAYTFFDCTVYSAPSIETWNKCSQKGVPTLAAEDYNRPSTPDEYSRTLAFFYLIGAVEPTANVESADLHLYSAEAAQNTDGVEVTRLTQPWNSYVSWKYSGHPNCFTCAPWTTPGGTGSEVVGQLTTAARPEGSGVGWWHVPLQEKMVQDWVTGGEPVNFGVAVKQLGEQVHSCTPTCLYRKLIFQSSAASNPSMRPYLTLTYYPRTPAGAEAKVISPPDGTRSARRLKLQAGWKYGVTAVTWQYREGKVGPYKDVPLELVREGDGDPVAKWPVKTPEEGTKTVPLYLDATQLSATLRKKGGPLQVRALFEGGAYGVSAPAEAKIDPAFGGPKDATAPVGPGSVDLLTGNLTVTRTDVSIPTFNSSLNFSRTFNSRDAGKLGDTGVLGQGWTPAAPIEEKGTGGFRSLKLTSVSEEGHTFDYAIVTGVEGHEFSFVKEGPSSYRAPDELPGFILTAPSSTHFVLAGEDGTRVVFNNAGIGGAEYLPVEVSQPGVTGDESILTYAVAGGKRRLTRVVAPAAPGINCATNPVETVGCKMLIFHYAEAGAWGAPVGLGARLSSIQFHVPGVASSLVAQYEYDKTTGRLTEVWDPRISPLLKETYTYTGSGQIESITPPGLKPWTMDYGTLNEEEVPGRLTAVKRDSLVAGIAQTTISYGVPLSGGSGLEPMTGTDVAKWGQTTIPVDATAIFPPDQVPTSLPPSSYSRATVYYMDSDGYAVNTATPKGAGTEGASISTSETDQYGNLVRELTPQNRVRALDAENPLAASKNLTRAASTQTKARRWSRNAAPCTTYASRTVRSRAKSSRHAPTATSNTTR